jgi:hypothetical protein
MQVFPGAEAQAIRIARSVDAGRTWAPAVTLIEGHAPFGPVQHHPSAAGDASGRWVIVWSGGDGSISIGLDEDVFVARSGDGGTTWSTPALLEADGDSDANDDRSPSIATDGAGTWLAAWATLPGVAVARSIDAGATWSSPVAFDAENFARPRIVAMGGGAWVVAYTVYAGLDSHLEVAARRSLDHGASWTAPATLGVGTDVDVATDGSTVAVVWDVPPGLTDAFITRSLDGGATWMPAAPFPFAGSSPRIAQNGAGTWAVTFLSELPSVVGNPGPYHAHATFSTDAAATFSPPTPIDTTAAATPATFAAHAAGAGDGSWVVSLDRAETTYSLEPPPACAPAPLAQCATPAVSGASRLKIRDATPDDRDSLAWKWARGDASLGTFGMPMLLHDYRLCGYAAGGLLFEALAPHGAGWRFTGTTRVGYGDRFRLPDGIDKVTLRASANGQGKVIARARGVHAPTPALPIALPVSVQLQAAHGPCWEATFSASGLKTNTPEVFSGKSD